MKTHPVVTLRPKAVGLLETTSEEERSKLQFDVEIRRESVQGFTAAATCKYGTYFPRASYEVVARQMIQVKEKDNE